MTISPFGWNDSAPPYLSAENLEAMLQAAGAYTDLVSIAVTQKGAANGVAPLDSAGLLPTNRLPASVVSGSALGATSEQTANKGVANGYASLDGSGKLPASQLTVDAMEYKGSWNASTNTPTLTNGTGSVGDFYITSVSGSSGPVASNAGDHVILNPSLVWENIAQSVVGGVTSFNTRNGAVTLTKTDVTGTGLAAADVGADVAGAATTAQNNSLQKSSNLSDVNNAATARTNLGLGTAATANTGTTTGTIPVLGASGTVALAQLGTGTPTSGKWLRGDGSWTTVSVTGEYVGSAATFAALPTVDAAGNPAQNGDWASLTADVIGTGTAQNPQYPRGIYAYNGSAYSLLMSISTSGALIAGNNLSDVANVATARTNLGLGTAATQPSTAFDAAGAASTEQTRAQAAEATKAALTQIPQNVVTKTTAYTAAAGDAVLASATGGAFSVTLPTPTLGIRVLIKKTDASTNAVTVVGTVDGTANPTLTFQNQALELIADGTAWQRVVRQSLAQGIVDYPATTDARYDALGAATTAQGNSLQKSANLSDVASTATARTNLGLNYGTTAGTVAQGNDIRIVNAVQAGVSGPGGTGGANLGATPTIPTPSGWNIFWGVANVNTTISLPAATAGQDFTLVVDEPVAGGSTIALSGSINWPNGTMTWQTGASARNAVEFFCVDGVHWDGYPITGPVLLKASNNLSDVANVATARTNLGLGTAAVANIDTTATDITMNGAQAAGATGKLADAGHVHPTDTSRAPIASPTFTGVATSPILAANAGGATGRYIGVIPSGGPTTGTWNQGDFGNTTAGAIWSCTTAGTPGTWASPGGGGGVVLDNVATDIVMNGVQAAGSTGKAADAGHVHPSDTTRAIKSLWRPASTKTETFTRDRISGNALNPVSGGRLYITGGCQLAAGIAVNTITFYSGSTGVGPYEVDSIAATGATSGTFQVSFTWNGNVYTTVTAINWNDTAATIQADLLAAQRTGAIAFSTDAGASGLTCTGGPLNTAAVTVTFQNNANGPVTAQTVSGSTIAGASATFTRTTSGVLPSNQWACLVDQSGNVLAKSTDATTSAWGANTAKAFTLSSTYTPSSDIGVYVGLVVVATTVPTLQGTSLLSTTGLATSVAPMVGATANTGLTNPASLGATIGAQTFNSNLAYATIG